MHRKRYLELSHRCAVGAGGFSSAGAGKGSRNPASERSSACKALFHKEDKPRGDGSPLKGCVARPRLPAAPQAERRLPACSPPLKSHTRRCWTIRAHYFDELGANFYIPVGIQLCRNHVFAEWNPSPVESHELQLPHSTVSTAENFSCRYLEIKWRGQWPEMQIRNNVITEFWIRRFCILKALLFFFF